MDKRNKDLGKKDVKDRDIEQSKHLRQDRDLPVSSDANKSRKDIEYRNQDEYDDESKQKLDHDARKQEARNERREDSQLGDERKIQSEKKKQSPKADKVDRKFPNMKK